jgi:predicted kinase
MAGILHLPCGKIAAGKSTLCARLGEAPRTVTISEDFWLKRLFGEEMREVADYVRASERLRTVMGPHVSDLLRCGLDVVLDFPGNRKATRRFWREAAEAAGARLLVYWLDVPDALCRERLRRRNAEGLHDFAGVSDEQFDLITSRFQPPAADEGILILRPA